jgi:hypothetical protein
VKESVVFWVKIAKSFPFLAKSIVSDLCLEERRKGCCGIIFLGCQSSVWLLAIVEEALKVLVKDFVKYFQEDVKVLMVRGGENKSGRYLEVMVFIEGGRKGAIWLLESRKDGGWAQVACELRKMTSFLDSKDRLMGFESYTSNRLGGSSSRQDGSPSYAAVVRGVATSHVKHAGMQTFG